MGTLFSQAERKWCVVSTADLDEFLSLAVDLAKKNKVAVSDVIKAKEVLEMQRRNDLYVNNGDTFDEQMMGIGELLQGISSAIENLSSEP